MNKKQLLDHLKNDVYCRIGISKIHGVGVIAVRDIPKGTDPFKNSFDGEGITITERELGKLDNGVRKIIDDMLVHEENTVMIPSSGLNSLDVSFYMNHSEEPNMISFDGGETFTSLREIKKNEELTHMYPDEEQKLL